MLQGAGTTDHRGVTQIATMRVTTVLSLVLLAACGGAKIPGNIAPEVLHDSAMGAYRRGDCDWTSKALEQFQVQVGQRDPGLPSARYYLAECMLRSGQRLEAARQFRRVADEFPQDPLASDGLLRAADAYMEMWSNSALDPTYGETARSTLGELMTRYPSSSAAMRARVRIDKLSEEFAQKEYRNGDYYFRFRAYDSAIIYYRDVVANYPQTRYAPMAVLRLITIYQRIDYSEEKQAMCGHLQRYYPDAAAQAEECG